MESRTKELTGHSKRPSRRGEVLYKPLILFYLTLVILIIVLRFFF